MCLATTNNLLLQAFKPMSQKWYRKWIESWKGSVMLIICQYAWSFYTPDSEFRWILCFATAVWCPAFFCTFSLSPRILGLNFLMHRLHLVLNQFCRQPAEKNPEVVQHFTLPCAMHKVGYYWVPHLVKTPNHHEFQVDLIWVGFTFITKTVLLLWLTKFIN